MSTTTSCPALMVAAPASGQGKTLVTAALARRHRNAGRRVRVFKCGPDFLDPMILERACGARVYQLDLFMCGEAECRRLLHAAAQEADLILVEGVMGLFDGAPSAADLAVRLGLPVLGVVDGSAMAQTFGALVHGLATYQPDLNLAAVLANRVAGDRHAQMLEGSLRGGVQWLGALLRNEVFAFPERHLGLVQAGEIDDLDHRIEAAARALPETALWLPPPVMLEHPAAEWQPKVSLAGLRIAIARDAAFGFIYPANLDLLESMGAVLTFFSPLVDTSLPDCDALWLPGGYPELHLRALSENRAMTASIRAYHRAGQPILAECGGMLYCVGELDDGRGTARPMLGLMPGRATMQPRLAALGLQEVTIAGADLRGHSFHFSRLETALAPYAIARNPNGGPGEAVFRYGSLWASYVHGYFPSAPLAVATILRGGPHTPAE